MLSARCPYDGRMSAMSPGPEHHDVARGAGPRDPRRRGRDRHGRGFRADLVPPHLPGFRTRRDRFDDLVMEAAEASIARFPRRLEHVRIDVEDVPPAVPTGRGEREIPLGRCIPADRHRPPQVIVYRRPIETRTPDAAERPWMVRQVLSEQFGALLGIPAEDVDPGAWDPR